MFCEYRVEQTPSEHAGQTVHMQIICTAYAQQVWQFLDSLDIVCECSTLHLPSVQSTYPEFLDVQHSNYLKGLMGMWKFWISICSIEISSQPNSQVEKDKMSEEMGTYGSSQCWKRRGGSPVPVQQPSISLLISAALPSPALFFSLSAQAVLKAAVLCLLCYPELAWLSVVACAHILPHYVWTACIWCLNLCPLE